MNNFEWPITYWTFEMPKTSHHNPYHMIMDSSYLLKMLNSMIFFYIKNNVMPLIQRKIILKDFGNHKLRYTIYKFIYSFKLIIQVLIFLCKFFIHFFIIDKV